MITDKELTFSQAQPVTDTAVSTNVYDNLNDAPITVDAPIYILIAPNELSGPEGATLQVEVQVSTTSDFAEFETLTSTGAIDVATIDNLVPIGQSIAVLLPAYGMRRFMRLNYVVTGGPLTDGTLWAGMVIGINANRAYANASSITN